MALKNASFVLGLTLLMVAAATATRTDIPMKPGDNLPARLEASGSLVECWNALIQIKSCSNEILSYFVNGQANIGPACCKAIATITHNCWPAMLSSIGFTDEEGYILRGYCDAYSAAAAPAPTQSHASLQI